MKKTVLPILSSFLLLLGSAAYAQTTATDFNINDCSGVSHHLFSELDGGKIIVAVFVMPCSGCIIPANDVQTVVQSYTASYPGRVEMYLIDDDGLTSCTEMNTWRNANGLYIMPTFSDTSVVQTQYGTPGMPKIVVLGGTSHHIYGNQNNTVDMELLKSQINEALGIPSGISATKSTVLKLNIFPNPATTGTATLTLSAKERAEFDIRLYDKAGKLVKSMSAYASAGDNKYTLDLSGLSSGIYTVKVTDGITAEEIKITVK
jgi:hypothetical protein